MSISLLLFMAFSSVPVQAANDDLHATLRWIMRAEPLPCPDARACYCADYNKATNPEVTYAKARYCPDPKSPELVMFAAWDINGNKVEEGRFLTGEKDGIFIGWHPNGARASETGFEKGKRVGPFKEWHANGQIAVVGQYANDKPDGSWLFRATNGRIKTRMLWDKGALKSKRKY
jgi:antitoxin component YwqK of YwqJK toxin-antitoxin module